MNQSIPLSFEAEAASSIMVLSIWMSRFVESASGLTWPVQNGGMFILVCLLENTENTKQFCENYHHLRPVVACSALKYFASGQKGPLKWHNRSKAACIIALMRLIAVFHDRLPRSMITPSAVISREKGREKIF